ncbi:MAG: SIR2 family protein [Nitrospinae bacterium]|nr:SIR2 family protein [Nitrospinota bacterium]MBF0634338.1 SIR2 family protein [Nitrospinota bacterium]
MSSSKPTNKLSKPTKLKFLKPATAEWCAIELDVAGLGDDNNKNGDPTRENREALRDMLLASLQMPNLVVLAGSGSSIGEVGGPSMQDLWDKAVKTHKDWTTVFDKVGYKEADTDRNIETLLSRCEAHQQLKDDETIRSFIEHCKKITLSECSNFLSDDKLKGHCTFLHRLSRRRVRDPRLKVFTSNYDLCFERAASLQGLIPIDGFSFARPRIFNSRFFNYDIVRRPRLSDEHGDYLEGVFHLLKLHGSVNWARNENGAIEEKTNPSPSEACLIYPASGKYQQSYLQPHLELFSQYLASLREPNTCLIVIGFGFNDNHMSEPILAAVRTNPHLRLVVVDFRAEDFIVEKNGYWKKLHEEAQGGGDVWFINSSFKEFAEQIPDLKALTPAGLLERAIKAIK